jgi:hypothetical protein
MICVGAGLRRPDERSRSPIGCLRFLFFPFVVLLRARAMYARVRGRARNASHARPVSCVCARARACTPCARTDQRAAECRSVAGRQRSGAREAASAWPPAEAHGSCPRCLRGKSSAAKGPNAPEARARLHTAASTRSRLPGACALRLALPPRTTMERPASKGRSGAITASAPQSLQKAASVRARARVHVHARALHVHARALTAARACTRIAIARMARARCLCGAATGAWRTRPARRSTSTRERKSGRSAARHGSRARPAFAS